MTQCEGFTQKADRCTREAEEFYETPGDAVNVCPRHYEVIMRRTADERELLVRRWRSLPGAPRE